MFLCRRLLPQILKPRRVIYLPFSSRLLFRGIHSISKAPDVYAAAFTTFSVPDDKNYTTDQPVGIGLSVELLLDKLSELTLHDTAEGFTEGEKPKSKEGQMEGGRRRTHDLLDVYTALRNSNRAAVAKLPLHILLDLVEGAAEVESVATTDNLAADTLEITAGHIQHTVAELLIMSSTSLLRHDRITDLLCLLEPTDAPAHVPLMTFQRLAKRVVNTPEASESSLYILSTRTIIRLGDLSAPYGALLMSYNPPPIIKLSFILVKRFLDIRKEQWALELFQGLVKSMNIPPEAIHPGNEGPEDFQFIILSTLARSSLHWGWRRLAFSLMEDVVTSPDSKMPTSSLAQIVEEVLFTILDTPLGGDVPDSGSLICALDRRDDSFIVPNGIFQIFYDAAEKLNLGSDAENLYAYTRSHAVMKKIQYPPPRGRALKWLMHHLTVTGRNMHLGRSLAVQVVDMDLPIPLQDRAAFIAITAEHGFGKAARALWERYSTGWDRDMVVGNAATMVRMVSLFMNISKRVATALGKLTAEDASAGELDEDKSFLEGEELLEDEVVPVPDKAGGVESLTPEFLEERLKNVTAFAERIAHEFRQTKEPLTEASHFDLTSLARAYFILGNFPAGFDVFRVLMDRREVPDMHDVNVALGAMSVHNPRAAARMIERMILKGMKPDAITIGTVLHHAIVHGDMDLFKSLISKSKELDDGQLTLKSMASLMRASVLGEKDTKTTLRANLQQALDIIRLLTDSRFVCIPNTGKYCIFASLQVGDPVMAFHFWSLLIKDKTQWDDGEQIGQRRQIADMIREHQSAGWIGRDQSRMMLSQMRMNRMDKVFENHGRSSR